MGVHCLLFSFWADRTDQLVLGPPSLLRAGFARCLNACGLDFLLEKQPVGGRHAGECDQQGWPTAASHRAKLKVAASTHAQVGDERKDFPAFDGKTDSTLAH